jgi:alpha-L-rhamnosidase
MQGNADVWDSGWVATLRNHSIDFAPSKPLNLPEASTIYWQAQTAISDDSKMVPCAMSPVASFRTGLRDWGEAQWICKSNDLPKDACSLYAIDGSNSAPLFRAEFDLAAQFPGRHVTSAQAYVSGMGHYNLYVNGEHINAGRYLDPGPASYQKRVYYNSFDVTRAATKYTNNKNSSSSSSSNNTNSLAGAHAHEHEHDHEHAGKLVVGMIAGNGWFNPLPMRFWGRFDLRTSMKNTVVGPPAALLRLQVTLDDGTKHDVVTNTGSVLGAGWETAGSAILRNDLYLGNGMVRQHSTARLHE